MKHIFIINPTAGKKNAAKELTAEIISTKQRTGAEVAVYLTERPLHATQIVKELAASGQPIRFYACGGDGTLNEVLCGAFGFDNAEVGHIPCGSGNDMIRNFGAASDFRNVEAMLLGSSKVIDLLEANGRITASICAAGMDGKVAYLAQRIRRLPLLGGGIAYDIAALLCFFGKIWYPMTLSVDGETVRNGDYILTAFGNGRYYGGGYKCLPGASLEDGLLSAVLVHKIPFRNLLSTLKKYKAGAHFTPEGTIIPEYQQIMTAFSAKEVTIHCDRKFYYTLDGETSFEHDLRVHILPKAVRFILPRTLQTS